MSCLPIVGQPILAAAGFQPALPECEEPLVGRKSRLKAGCGQDCPPHDYRQKCGSGRLASHVVHNILGENLRGYRLLWWNCFTFARSEVSMVATPPKQRLMLC